MAAIKYKTMKAKNTNGNIQTYSEQQFESQFNFYNNTHLWHLSDKEVLEAEGFFDVIVPDIQEGERLGAIYFDEENSVFTYPIEPIPAKSQYEIDAETRALRNQLLEQGIITSNGIWFNEKYLGNFINAMTLSERAGATTIDWKDDNNVWLTMTFAEGNAVAIEAMMALQAIYQNH